MNSVQESFKKQDFVIIEIIIIEMVDTHNGSAIIGMIGKNCVAIAADTRLGVQLKTVSTQFKKVYQATPHCLLAMTGLATDIQTLASLFKYKTNMYKLRENEDISAEGFANLVATTLYSRRLGPYFVAPIVAGLDKDKKTGKIRPTLSTYDFIGTLEKVNNFVVGGTAKDLLYGACESLYKEDMEQEELFKVISQALLASMDRDILSGWGAKIYIMTPDQLIVRKLKTRID